MGGRLARLIRERRLRRQEDANRIRQSTSQNSSRISSSSKSDEIVAMPGKKSLKFHEADDSPDVEETPPDVKVTGDVKTPHAVSEVDDEEKITEVNEPDKEERNPEVHEPDEGTMSDTPDDFEETSPQSGDITINETVDFEAPVTTAPSENVHRCGQLMVTCTTNKNKKQTRRAVTVNKQKVLIQWKHDDARAQKKLLELLINVIPKSFCVMHIRDVSFVLERAPAVASSDVNMYMLVLNACTDREMALMKRGLGHMLYLTAQYILEDHGNDDVVFGINPKIDTRELKIENTAIGQTEHAPFDDSGSNDANDRQYLEDFVKSKEAEATYMALVSSIADGSTKSVTDKISGYMSKIINPYNFAKSSYVREISSLDSLISILALNSEGLENERKNLQLLTTFVERAKFYMQNNKTTQTLIAEYKKEV